MLNVLGIGMQLDKIYHGMDLPGKMKMAVSGCSLSCAESWVRDIGLMGKPKGWTLVIGGNVGVEAGVSGVKMSRRPSFFPIDASS